MGKGRAPCCEKVGLKKGSWTPAEDMRLMAYIHKHGHGNWRALPKQAGLLRCGKSCRLRWINYLRPDIKRGNFTKEEEDAIIELHQKLGNKWSKIASRLPGRTDNEIKNVWNTHLKKRLVASKEQNPSSPEKHTEPPGSPSSGSTTSDCSQGRGEGEEDINIIINNNNNSSSKYSSCSSDNMEKKNMQDSSSSEEWIEIPLQIPNLDVFDMLDEGSSSSPNSNNDMETWDVHFNKHFGPPRVPNQLTHEPKPDSSTCSSTSANSGITQHHTPDQPTIVEEDYMDMFIDVPVEPEILTSNLHCMFFSTEEKQEMGHKEDQPATSVENNNRSWIEYLEKELDLWGANEGYQQQVPLMEGAVEQQPPLVSWQALDVAEVDPIASYFQKLQYNIDQ